MHEGKIRIQFAIEPMEICSEFTEQIAELAAFMALGLMYVDYPCSYVQHGVAA